MFREFNTNGKCWCHLQCQERPPLYVDNNYVYAAAAVVVVSFAVIKALLSFHYQFSLIPLTAV